jgi:hypothetical protein
LSNAPVSVHRQLGTGYWQLLSSQAIPRPASLLASKDAAPRSSIPENPLLSKVIIYLVKWMVGGILDLMP